MKLDYCAESPRKEPFLKRPLDVVLTGVMLILSLPVVLPIALLIKLGDGGGPLFYVQKRWGRNGTRFKAFKFRTMVPDSDDKFGVIPATEKDHRVTRIGLVLRAMGLDELPQVLNILRGDMSFVGPRSLAVGEPVTNRKGQTVQYENIAGFRERLSVRPGLTGVATIYIRKDSPPERKFRYDLLYVRKQSIWLDIHLIALSFWISFLGRWETRSRKL
ncbi:MAG: sugar transferase [Deltaproteobacteria bacterium]|nr:sugar transferase [Deltaproteobacteria bacterium]